MVIFYKMPKTSVAKYPKREIIKLKYKMFMSLRKVRPVALIPACFSKIELLYYLYIHISTDILSSSINLLGEIWKQIEVNKVPILYLLPWLKIKACCAVVKVANCQTEFLLWRHPQLLATSTDKDLKEAI